MLSTSKKPYGLICTYIHPKSFTSYLLKVPGAMQQVLSNGASVAARGLQGRVPSQRHTATAFKPAIQGNKVLPARKLSATVRATAAPATAQSSPFAAVNSEAALFAILKAGAAGGKVRLVLMILSQSIASIFIPS